MCRTRKTQLQQWDQALSAGKQLCALAQLSEGGDSFLQRSSPVIVK
jgi:hypothetical protein